MRKTNVPAVSPFSFNGMSRLCAMRAASRTLLAVALACTALPLPAFAQTTAAPSGAEQYIIWPSDGAVIHGGKLWVRMGLRNMGVCPKGVSFPNCGHHHLLIDTDLPALDQEIPSDRNHLHFGAGETDARIELPPGKHTLQLILGDHNHVPFAPPVYSKKITITVQKD
ncbi:DUF4399 domain-containing protein [bacterium M00.F.Ca.ET.228.01.1.1]|uniref:DUF4399 domain-containing protein n=1 Tax=Paraburkholderia phenoliruptrix TaxID=252970 RepID=UPI00109243EA|nr:DUF4399 domain-containing protein [Paraburkholderia phenoliruptrix]TGP47427.1 DUF4399 domain-containing protein [bacterium M00.F.Ca.ET.228.01.1.1]TGS05219.1 DUF4399 domain-containing protein [bacterium M00.F.Ca.ET.191.01.1.1]TGU10155.1 DUF4399 domain-containing protein [bacterium M00.F.Ca.ET.155.01.1.1]MBW0449573.1 DUF4399 domain-containing protein [Paraburkholderia phenoliruptrix]MBW9101191.1 DUF4399 domain-containing protein [Paraburkholderia phenoliruptrix]